MRCCLRPVSIALNQLGCCAGRRTGPGDDDEACAACGQPFSNAAFCPSCSGLTTTYSVGIHPVSSPRPAAESASESASASESDEEQQPAKP